MSLERDEQGRPVLCDTVNDAKLRKVRVRIRRRLRRRRASLRFSQVESDDLRRHGGWLGARGDSAPTRTRATYSLGVDPGPIGFLARPLERAIKPLVMGHQAEELAAGPGQRSLAALAAARAGSTAGSGRRLGMAASHLAQDADHGRGPPGSRPDRSSWRRSPCGRGWPVPAHGPRSPSARASGPGGGSGPRPLRPRPGPGPCRSHRSRTPRRARTRRPGRSGPRDVRRGLQPRSGPTAASRRSARVRAGLPRPAGGRPGSATSIGSSSRVTLRSPAPGRSRTPGNWNRSARSNSPARRRGPISSGSPSARVRATSGCCLAKAGHGQRHQRRAGRRERGHAQASRADAEHRRQVGLGRLDLGEDRLGVRDQCRPGGGRPDAPPIADDQGGAGLRLETRDRLRDGRLRVGESLGSGGERPAVDHFDKHLETAEAQH